MTRTLMVALVLLTGTLAWAQEATEPPVPPADGVWRFDFGPAEGAVGAGCYPVAPETAYDAARGYGYTAGRARIVAFDQNRRVLRDTLVLDDVTRDGIYGGTPFRVDLPNGRYHVAVLTGEYSKPGANRPDAHGHAYTITAGGQALYEQGDSPEEFFAPDGRYFANYYRDWRPDVDLYAANIARWIPWAEGDVEVTGGALEVAASQYAPINALFVFAVGSEAGEAALAEVRAGQAAFFNAQYPWLAEEPERAMPELPAGMAAAGVAVWVRADAGDLRPNTRPIAQDLGRPLRLFACPGEREAGVIAVTPLRDLDGTVDLVVGDLTGANGATIPAAAVDIRYVRFGEYPVTGGYEVRPHYLVPWRPERLEAGITRGFWVDLHTPADAQPGFYAGTLALQAPGAEVELPLEVRVLPLELPMSDCYQGVYAGDLNSTTFRHFRMQNRLPEELVARVLRTRMQFLAEQGFTGLFDSLPWYPLEFGADGQLVTTQEWAYYLLVWRTAASIPNFSERVLNYYLGGNQLFPKCEGFLTRGALPQTDIDDIGFSDATVEQMCRMVSFIYEQTRAEGLPDIVFYVQDELGNDGAKGARYGRELLKAINRCREQVPGGFRTCVSTLRAAIAREFLDEADIIIPNSAYPITTDTIAEIREHGCTLGLYNLGATRFSYGFYPWRVDAYCRAQWSFTYDGDSRDPFVALPSGSRVSCDCHYTPEWEVLPSIGMLVQREGVDDYRYVQLLEQSLAAAQEAGRGGTEAARAAQATLDELRAAVSEDYLDPANNWDRATMDYWRWRVARAAMALQGD